jgi:hypothetical protein
LGIKLTQTGPGIVEAAGVKAAASFTNGFEITSPLPGSTNPVAVYMQKFLDKHGEGPFSIVYEVDELEPAMEQAKRAGYSIMAGPWIFPREVIDSELQGAFTQFDEVMIQSPAHEYLVALNVLKWRK